MNIELQHGETLIRDGLANLERGMEQVGGRLFLTDRRLQFMAHAMNVQTAPLTIALGDVTQVKMRWTRFLGFLPLLPNSMGVGTTGGTEYRFAVWRRRKWRRLIRKQVEALDAGTGAGATAVDA